MNPLVSPQIELDTQKDKSHQPPVLPPASCPEQGTGACAGISPQEVYRGPSPGKADTPCPLMTADPPSRTHVGPGCRLGEPPVTENGGSAGPQDVDKRYSPHRVLTDYDHRMKAKEKNKNKNRN